MARIGWRRLVLAAVWLLLLTYGFVFAPPDDGESTWRLLEPLIRGDVAELNPLLVAEFNLMGVLPLIFWCFLFRDGHGFRPPAWPFAGLMMALGGFALLPYLVFRQGWPRRDQANFQKSNWWLALWESRWTGGALLLLTGALVTYGVSQGDWPAFGALWQTQRFVHIMTLDFFLLLLLLPVMINDDLSRRGLTKQGLVLVLMAIPLFGPLVYLCWRSPIRTPDRSEEPLAEAA